MQVNVRLNLVLGKELMKRSQRQTEMMRSLKCVVPMNENDLTFEKAQLINVG